MNKFATAMKRETGKTRTENAAVTHSSTFSAVLDFFYHAASRQGEDNLPLFIAAYEEDKNLAIRAVFYLRDVRGGKGQRKTIRDVITWLARKDAKGFDEFAVYVPEYGRWDDLTRLVGFKVVQELVRHNLALDA